MLLRQDRGRHEHGDLFPIHHGLERRAHGDLGLPVPHVPAHQAVHRPRRLHVPLHVLDRLPLVGGLLEAERLLHLALPRGIGGE